MQDGNPQYIVGGGAIDTGRKYTDANGLSSIIYQKTLAIGSGGGLPNATTKNVAHGVTGISLTKHCKVTQLRADNGTTIKTLESVGVTAEVNATNVVLAAVADLSLFIRGVITLEYCLA